MGKIILCTGYEKNIGVTSSTLLLSNTIAGLLQKKILAVDFNIKHPEFSKILFRNNESAAYNVDTVMNYASTNNSIEPVLNGNVEHLNNSSLEILMGTNLKQGFKEQQYVNFLYEAAKLYEFTFVDSCTESLDQAVIDYSDMILLFTNQSVKMNNDLIDCHWKIIKDEKTFIVVNRYESSLMSTKRISDILKKEVNFKISYDKTITDNINNGNLNIGDSKALTDIKNIGTYILKRYELIEQPKLWQFLAKLGGSENK